MPQIVVSNQDNPYLNLAVENYLLSQPDVGGALLYLWQNRRTVVIGQNQNPFAECNVERLEADGGYLMRRRTGGGAVYHDLGNLNFSFVVPEAGYDVARQLSVMQHAVEAFGLHTEVSGRNDVLCEGRKFSGNAFSRGGINRLHHGTILIRTDVAELQRYLIAKPAKLHKHGVASVQSRIVNLSELVDSINAEALKPLLVEAFEQEYGKAERLDFDAIALLPEVKSLRDEFASDQWKYGRWRTFRTQRHAQYDWGEVDLAVTVDEAAGRIDEVLIASDSLNPEAIALAERMLKHAPLDVCPDTSDCPHKEMLDDIFKLIYEKD